MNVLLDTHALLWWFNEPEKMSDKAVSTVRSQNNAIYVSAASAWELSIKAKLGKLQTVEFVLELERHMDEENFLQQPITIEQSIRAGMLPLHHRDPFDRLLVAQAQAMNVALVSADSVLDQYGVRRIW
jgi:PIN domain nuclease of toxin-antitoxin system